MRPFIMLKGVFISLKIKLIREIYFVSLTIFLKTVGNASAFYITREWPFRTLRLAISPHSICVFDTLFIRLFLFHFTARTSFIKKTIFYRDNLRVKAGEKKEKKARQGARYNGECITGSVIVSGND